MAIKELSKQVFQQSNVILIDFAQKDAVKGRFSELNYFKHQISAIATSFDTHRKSALIYRTVFLSLGLLFLGLMAITFLQNASWFCSFYFTNCILAKGVLSGICGLLGVSSVIISTCIRAEKEAAVHTLKKFKRRLAIVYHQQCHKLGWKRFLRIFEGCAQAAGIRRAYREAIDKLNEICDSTLYLMMHISHSSELDKAHRERLLTQALLEMDEKLEKVIQHVDETVNAHTGI